MKMGLEGRAETRLTLAQARLALAQFRFRLLALRDVQRHAEHVRHMIEVDELRRDQHGEPSSGPVAEAALPFADGAGAGQIDPESAAICLLLPEAKLKRISSQDFVAGIA